MSLYVRVLNNFYTHRKTLRLKASIGEAAYWVPPRLWAYAAQNQPDGCFKDYSGAEIAMLIGYLGDAKALLQALLQAGFLDSNPIRIHDWLEHNAYHSTFAERARKGAAGRWADRKRTRPDSTVPDLTVPDLTVPDLTRKEASIASSMKRPKFEHPTMEAMKLQGAKIGLPDAESEACFHHYESNGSLVGRNPMKSWPAAMQNWKRTYESRRYQNNGGNHSGHPRPVTGAEQRQLGIGETGRTMSASQILAAQRKQREDAAAAAKPVATTEAGA